MMSGLSANDYESRLRELNMDSLETRRRKLDLMQAYKIVTGKDMVDSSIWFTTQEEARSRITRQTEFGLNIVRTTVSRTDIRQNTFSQRVINQWNELPNEIKQSVTINGFRKAVNVYFKEHGW